MAAPRATTGSSSITTTRHTSSDPNHLPPGNDEHVRQIQHRLFSLVSRNWRARPLISMPAIVSIIAATTSSTGLEVVRNFPLRPRGMWLAHRGRRDAEKGDTNADGPMYELIPIVGGCAAGSLLWSLRPAWLAVALVVAVGVAAGTLAATISGELGISAGFLLWDVGQGVFVGLAVLVLARRVMAARAAAP
jgi:hypothetical protein